MKFRIITFKNGKFGLEKSCESYTPEGDEIQNYWALVNRELHPDPDYRFNSEAEIREIIDNLIPEHVSEEIEAL